MSVAGNKALYWHRAPHKEIVRRYRHYASKREFRLSILASFFLLAVAIWINSIVIPYATQSASNPVTDIILNNIPVFDTDALFVYGTFIFFGLLALFVLAHPKRIPFTMRTLALFWIIRAGFVTLTHIAPQTAHTATDFGPTITKMFFGDDLFFSGHTGSPFLLALIYWEEKYLRYVFLASSVFFAAIVLMGHLHYSIDVASAFFITYAIYDIAKWLFPRDYDLFHSDMPAEQTA